MIQSICCQEAIYLSHMFCKKHGTYFYPVNMPPPFVELQAQLAEAKAENKALREALEPFANMSGWIFENGKTLGETYCFKAKEALRQKDKP